MKYKQNVENLWDAIDVLAVCRPDAAQILIDTNEGIARVKALYSTSNKTRVAHTSSEFTPDELRKIVIYCTQFLPDVKQKYYRQGKYCVRHIRADVAYDLITLIIGDMCDVEKWDTLNDNIQWYIYRDDDVATVEIANETKKEDIIVEIPSTAFESEVLK